MSEEIKYPIYLDYQSTTPVDPRVVEAMLPYFTEIFGNPASKSHQHGHDALAAVENARKQVAKAIHAKPQEIVFTSGSTEAINLAIKGTALANRSKGNHFITVATEHKAVLDCYDWLQRNGFEVTILPVDSEGMLDPQQVADAITPQTVLVSVMLVNNEIGVIQPISEIGKICREKDVYFFTDATQGLGKVPIDVNSSCVDLLCGSGHKIYGPKGIGFLYVRRSNPRVRLEPILHGGGHEGGLRSGTLPTAQIVGLGAAISFAITEMQLEAKKSSDLMGRIIEVLKRTFPDLKVNGGVASRIPSNLNISLGEASAEALIAATQGKISISTGSACTSTSVEPSHVLSALGLNANRIGSSIRISIGRFSTLTEIDAGASIIAEQAQRLSSLI